MAKRSIEEVQKEYNQKCAELGQETYRVDALNAEIEVSEKKIEQLKRDLKYLNIEAGRIASKAPATEEQPQTTEVANEQSTEAQS